MSESIQKRSNHDGKAGRLIGTWKTEVFIIAKVQMSTRMLSIK